MITFHNNDCIAWAAAYEGPLFHALLCDAPYHLTSITKRYKKVGEGDIAKARSNPFRRTATGFMGQDWDGGDIAFRPETWKAFKKLLHPGAFGIAFAGSRGWHRQAVAIEDAGFIIHPTLFGWAYSSGMPKATRVPDPRFEGHRYGLQALKPAVEPIIVFQKPYEGKPKNNIMGTGAGVLNIEAAKIPGKPYVINRYKGLRLFTEGEGPYQTEEKRDRWASNLLLLDDGAAEAIESASLGASEVFFTVREQLDAADPIFYSQKANRKEKEAGLDDFPAVMMGYSNEARSKGAAQDRHTIGLNNVNPRRNPHPTVKPLALTRYLAGLLLPPVDYAPRRLVVPFSGVGSECIGAALAGWEEVEGIELKPEYVPIAEARASYWLAKEESRAVPGQTRLL